MSIGGTNNAVTGINLTDAELAQIYTTASGTVTFGDSSQTGNITFTTATPATTAGRIDRGRPVHHRPGTDHPRRHRHAAPA